MARINPPLRVFDMANGNSVANARLEGLVTDLHMSRQLWLQTGLPS